MKVKDFLLSSAKNRKAIPILAFPAAKKLGIKVGDLVKSSVLAADAIEYVAKNTDIAAAVTLMDLSIEAEAFGAKIVYKDDEVPAIVGSLVTDSDEAEALSIPSLSEGRVPMAIETVRLSKERIKDKPLIAGMLGPYSLAGRLLDVTEIIYLCYDEPELVHTVLDKVTTFLISYANAFKEAGADGVLMAEPLAGVLSPAMAEEFSVPYVKRIVEAVKSDDFAIIYHNCGNSIYEMADAIYSQNATAYHFGNAVKLENMISKAPDGTICMGNVDPVGCFTDGTVELMKKTVDELIESCGDYPYFIPSSGCDIPAHANWELIDAFFEALG